MNYFSLLPKEIVYQIFDYSSLNFSELKAINATCRCFQQIVKPLLENNPQYKLIPKMPRSIIQENANLLFRYLDKDFIIHSTNKLMLAESQNIFYRVSNQFYKLFYLEHSKQQISKVIELTLQEIYKLNQRSHSKLYCSNETDLYKTQYPAYILADKIISSEKFHQPEIIELANLIHQQDELYPIVNPQSSGDDRRIISEYDGHYQSPLNETEYTY